MLGVFLGIPEHEKYKNTGCKRHVIIYLIYFWVPEENEGHVACIAYFLVSLIKRNIMIVAGLSLISEKRKTCGVIPGKFLVTSAEEKDVV